MMDLDKISLTLIFRKKISGRNSIEELFGSIATSLEKDQIKIKKINLPQSGGSPLDLLKNILFVRKIDSNIIHITGDVHYASIFCTMPTILTIHDVKSILRGHFFKKLYLKIFWFYIPAIFVEKITVISKYSKNELLEIIPFAKNKISVIYNPYNEKLLPFSKKFNYINPKILHLGTKVNKNLERTILALKNISCELIIIGKLSQKQRCLLLTNNICYKNYYQIPYEKVIELYHRCDLVSFASLYEGFGMPIIEAQFLKRAVITSNVGSMPEIAGNGACLVNPTEISSIRDGIIKVIKNDAYREQLIINGHINVNRFNPKTITDEYKKVYSEVLTKKNQIV